MESRTPRHALPLIEPGQAQKELAHNEALSLIDAMLHAAVEGPPRNDPPAAPHAGGCWIVGAAPMGAWAGHADRLAAWTAGGWRFVAPRPGMAVWDRSAGVMLRHADDGWRRPPAVAVPAGGANIDTEAREALRAIAAVLRGHGLAAG